MQAGCLRHPFPIQWRMREPNWPKNALRDGHLRRHPFFQPPPEPLFRPQATPIQWASRGQAGYSVALPLGKIMGNSPARHCRKPSSSHDPAAVQVLSGEPNRERLQTGGGQGHDSPPERTRQGSPLEARLRLFRRLGVSTQGGKPARASTGILEPAGGMSRPRPASPAGAKMSGFVRLCPCVHRARRGGVNPSGETAGDRLRPSPCHFPTFSGELPSYRFHRGEGRGTPFSLSASPLWKREGGACRRVQVLLDGALEPRRTA